MSTVPIPKLLQTGNAVKLNDALLKNAKIFAFVGVPDHLINRTPSTYSEAFGQYSTALYQLYHDYGMSFIECFAYEAQNILKRYQYSTHIKTINNMRTIVAHGMNDDACDKVFRSLNNYFFRSDPTFKYENWEDFWQNAPENHWEILIKKLVDNSDEFYKFLNGIANDMTDSTAKKIRDVLITSFENGEFIIPDRSSCTVSMYKKSFNNRFMRAVCRIAEEKYDSLWTDRLQASNLLRALKNDQELIDKAITAKLKEKLNAGTLIDSQTLYEFIIQVIFEFVESSIEPDDEDIFE